MSHLNLEALARLVDEAPTALEAAHLAACDACREELQALHDQSAQLAVLPALSPPAEDWDRLEQRLQEEGLIRKPLAAHALTGRTRSWAVYGMRAAAAVALFAVGTITGRALQPERAPGIAATRPAPVIHATSPAPARDSYPAVLEPERVQQIEAEPAPQRRLASSAPAARAPRSAEEAFDFLQQAESSYLEALARFAELSGSTRTDDPTARLAALEGIVLTTRAALAQAPTDPVINGYHLTALAQRDATLRQVSAGAADRW